MFPNFLWRLVINSLTEDSTLLKPLLQTGQAKVYITGRTLDVLEKAAASVTGVPGSIIPSVIVLRLTYPLLMHAQTSDGRDRRRSCQGRCQAH